MSLEFTPKELAALKAEFCKGFTDEQAEVCFAFCRVRNLIPGKHVVFQLRRSKEWDEVAQAKVPVIKIVFITTIDAARLIALRSGQYVGQDPETYIYLEQTGDFKESGIPLPTLPIVPGTTPFPREPWAVRTTVHRKDFSHPMFSVARFDAYAATYNGTLSEMWAKRGPEQLAKCSEMLSLRKAFPEDLGSLYIAEELKNEEEAPIQRGITPASVVPLPPTVPQVNQTPAEPTTAPRPNEIKHNLPEETKIDGKIVTLPDAKAVEAAKKAVPDLKPASELPIPEKNMRGPKPKKPKITPADRKPNQRDIASEGGITDQDFVDAQTPRPVVDEAAEKRAAEEFVGSITNMTTEEAAAEGLPEPPDCSRLPNKIERDAYIVRTRVLPEPGVDIKSIGDYMLHVANKVGQASKNLTVGDWDNALGLLETAKTAGTLKQLVKGVPDVPLPAF